MTIHSTAQHSAAQRSTAQHSAAQRSTAQHSTHTHTHMFQYLSHLKARDFRALCASSDVACSNVRECFKMLSCCPAPDGANRGLSWATQSGTLRRLLLYWHFAYSWRPAGVALESLSFTLQQKGFNMGTVTKAPLLTTCPCDLVTGWAFPPKNGLTPN